MAFVLRRKPKLSPTIKAYPYQLDAIRAVKDLDFAAIFHEQGLGKTKIAIDLALVWLQSDIVDTVFIVTKKSLVENWRREISRHCDIFPHVLSGNRAKNGISLNSPVLVYITNYETIVANNEIVQLFLQTCRVGCILDESQKIKNPHSAVTRTFLGMAELFERRIIMTGTPAANRPFDIWAQIKFLDGGVALGDSFKAFREKMDLPNERANSDQYARRLGTIFQCIAPFSVRETKLTAGIKLPNKTIVTHYVELETWQMSKYLAYRNELAYEYYKDGEIKVDDVESILKRLLRLVQCASNPALIDGDFKREPSKYTLLIEMCRDLTSTSKIIVWSGFVENVEWLAKKLLEFKPVRIHGRLPMDQRNSAVDAFMNSTNQVLIATPAAAKEGLTLTVANHAIFYDRGFSLDDYLQAQDRIHRISQTQECFIHNLIAKDTIDEWIDMLLTAKYKAAQLAQGDIDKSTFRNSFRTDITDILREILSRQSQVSEEKYLKNEEDSIQ